MTDRLGRLLLVTLEAACLRADVHPLPAVRSRLDSWRGIGAVSGGMHRQGYDLQLTQYDDRGWRASFYTTGMEHSPTRATGSAWEPTPWHAVQGAARDAVMRGASLADVKEVLGHADVKMTLRNAHLISAHLRTAGRPARRAHVGGDGRGRVGRGWAPKCARSARIRIECAVTAYAPVAQVDRAVVS